MRKLLQLIGKYWNIILFIILEVICFTLISKNRSIQGIDVLSSSNAVAGYLYKKQNDIIYYFQLKKMNDSLLNENTNLRNQLSSYSNIDIYKDSLVKILDRDTVVGTKDTTNHIGKSKKVKYASYHYIPARVINNSVSNDKINYITINRGYVDGVRKDMAVVTPNGIVGRVANVSENYSSIVSVLSVMGDRRISSKLEDGTTGFTAWISGNPDFVSMDKIPLTVKVSKGDSVFTTGYSYFPENVLIGIVNKVDTIKASNMKNLKVKLSTNFRKLQYVYVVKNKLGEEKKILESKNEE